MFLVTRHHLLCCCSKVKQILRHSLVHAAKILYQDNTQLKSKFVVTYFERETVITNEIYFTPKKSGTFLRSCYFNKFMFYLQNKWTYNTQTGPLEFNRLVYYFLSRQMNNFVQLPALYVLQNVLCVLSNTNSPIFVIRNKSWTQSGNHFLIRNESEINFV